MAKTRTTTEQPTAESTARLVVPKAPRLGRWSMIIAVGLAVSLGGGAWSYLHRQAALSQAQAVGDARAQVEALRRWATQAASAQANPVELAQIQAQLQHATTDLGTPSTALANLTQMSQGWPAADVAQGQAAAVALPDALSAWRTADGALTRQSTLVSGSWAGTLGPLRQELAAVDPATLTSVFAPQADRITLQAQWAERLKQYATAAQGLATQATQDATLSSAARAAVSEWAQRWQAVADQAQVLATTAAARVQAQGWANAIAPLAIQAEAGLPSPTARVGAPEAVLGLGLLMAILGTLGLGLSLGNLARHQDTQKLQGQRRRLALESLDRMTRQLRQMVGTDGVGHGMIQEDSRSPGYALASLINQLIGGHDALTDELDRQQAGQGRALEQLRRQARDFRGLAHARVEHADQDSRLRLLQAQGLASLGQQAKRLLAQAQDIYNGFHRAHAAVQETAWRNETLRDGTQGQAKSLKRLSEGTQGISVTNDAIQQLAQRIQIQAMNAVIESAQVGPAGRKLAMISQEIQALAHSTLQSVQEINQLVRHIQDDAQGTVAAMEVNTTNVVETGNRATQASTLLQEIEQIAQGMNEGLTRITDALEGRAVDDAQAAEGATGTRRAFEALDTQAQAIEETSAQALDDTRIGFASLRQRLGTLPAP